MYYNKNIFVFLLLFAVNIYAQQNKIKQFTIEEGIANNTILNITQDEIGYLWIATDKGLVKFDGDDFTQINNQKTTSVFVEKNIIYAGLENGLFVKKKSKEQFFECKKILKIYSFKEVIFVATVQGIYLLNEDYLQPIQINTEIDFSTINDIIFLNNSFYVATNKGLWILNSLKNPKQLQKIIKENITSLAVFQKKIIAATFKNGLKIIDYKTVEKTITTQENITSVKKIKNEIWVTSNENGIEIYSLPSFSFKQKINKYNSLKTNKINSVFKDNQNTIWIASQEGLYNLKNSITKSLNNKKPIIYLESITVNNQNLDTLLNSKKTIKLSPSENNISISYKTINLTQPRNIEYRHSLDNTFSSWSKNNTVQFANLNPGKYTLRVQSKNKDNLSALNFFSFIIDKPFYKKTEFVISVIILILLAGYIFLDIYLKKINTKNKTKINKLKLDNHLLSLEQKALQLQMNPHFIFNVLNGIKALGNSGKTDELNTTISQFSVLLRSILNNSRKEEISLKEEIESLKNYIELEQRMSSKNFEYFFNINLNSIDAEEILIPTMLIQPFLENAIKHGFQVNKNGKIQVSFEVKNNYLHCSVLDNGIGIHQSKKQTKQTNHNSIALKVSKERIENISNKNSFSIDEIIEDSAIKGTKVWFKIPLKTDY
jgi:two-component system sensor histidine kinase LytS